MNITIKMIVSQGMQSIAYLKPTTIIITKHTHTHILHRSARQYIERHDWRAGLFTSCLLLYGSLEHTGHFRNAWRIRCIDKKEINQRKISESIINCNIHTHTYIYTYLHTYIHTVIQHHAHTYYTQK